jgi:hypothetical protein
MDNVLPKLWDKLDRTTATIWALDCAEHVLPFFEKKYPRDKRPRQAIEAARAWARGKTRVGPARTAALAAHATARKAKDNTARAAARAAGQAAATAHVVSHATHAADYAAKAVGYSVDATKTDAAIAKEQEWQYHRLLTLRRKPEKW